MKRRIVTAAIVASVTRHVRQGEEIEDKIDGLNAEIKTAQRTVDDANTAFEDAKKRLKAFQGGFQKAVENGRVGKKSAADFNWRGRGLVAAEVVKLSDELTTAKAKFELVKRKCEQSIAQGRAEIKAIEAEIDRLELKTPRASKPVAPPVLTVISTPAPAPIEPPKPKINIVSLFDKWGGIGQAREQRASK